MEHYEKAISLNFNRKDFEEIYFKNNQQNFLASYFVRRELITFLIFFLLLICSIIYSMLTDKSAWLVFVLSFFALLFFIPYYLKTRHLLKWRKQVLDFIKKNEQIKDHKLVLNNNSLSLIQDGTEEIHLWSAFSHVEIFDSHLILTGTAQYFFPKKSMSHDDYNFFLQAVKSHVKNGL